MCCKCLLVSFDKYPKTWWLTVHVLLGIGHHFEIIISEPSGLLKEKLISYTSPAYKLMFGVPTQHTGSQGTPLFITLTSKTHHSIKGIFVYILCFISIFFSFSGQLSEYRKGITISVICESLSPIYQIV